LTQPNGGWQEDGGVAEFTNVELAVGVGDSSPSVGMGVGDNVEVAVRGAGDGKIILVGVGVASGTNSTSEMDNAPIINPIEISAITSAFPKPRRPCIISFLWL
jgi:hypothetical protein